MEIGNVLAEFFDLPGAGTFDLREVMDVGSFDELALQLVQIVEFGPQIGAEGPPGWNPCRDPGRSGPR